MWKSLLTCLVAVLYNNQTQKKLTWEKLTGERCFFVFDRAPEMKAMKKLGTHTV